jgi:3'-phosphoadenosine 5'-phosphosulfate sulfotransferase
MFFSLPYDIREKIWDMVRNMRIDEIREQMEKDRIERLSMIRKILLNIEWINYCEAYLSQLHYHIHYVEDSSH